jgi:hypothetical protein
LSACANVQQAACTVQGEGAHQRLVAFVVPADRAVPLRSDDLKSALARVLPAYMVPSRIVEIDGLPTTLGGKLDRKGLPVLPAEMRGAATTVCRHATRSRADRGRRARGARTGRAGLDRRLLRRPRRRLAARGHARVAPA